MCGRYAFYQRPAEVRRQLEESQMPCDDCPEDDAVRQTYNFAPGSFGLVYRADVPYYGAGPRKNQEQTENYEADAESKEVDEDVQDISSQPTETHYKLQAMKWGLVPSWTKRNPDYGSLMRTINCRDDSLIENRGMWNTMKKRKRCIVLCQGFYEWLNKGKSKVPHFTKRKDGQLMCFAGLWDRVKYEDSDEEHYTYSVITTDSNKQLKFLHDRMPVIFDNGSEAIRTWLDPKRYEWSKELQSLLKPYEGELECYPVNQDVGKVGNNSPSFVIPVNSTENKNNIANFFGNQKKLAEGVEAKKSVAKAEEGVKAEGFKVEHDAGESRDTTGSDLNENNAPLPSSLHGVKREHSSQDDDGDTVSSPVERKVPRLSQDSKPNASPPKSARKMRSATSNGNKASQSKTSTGNQKITNFFGK